MTRLKSFVSNPVEPGGDEPQQFVSLEYIESGTGRLLPGTELPEKIDETAIAHQAGDVRFGKLRPYLAKSLLMETPGIGSGELLVLRPRPEALDSRFLWYLTLSKPFLAWAEVSSYGVKMPRTNWTLLGAWDAWIPPLAEQRDIATYLDAEVGRIDGIISEQQELVTRLCERRAALIDYAVAKGLDPDVQMKDSGVGWLGTIPNHWRAGRLKHYAKATIGLTFSPDDVVLDPSEGVLVLRSGNIQEAHIVLEDNVYASCEVPSELRLKGGEILICSRNGSAALIGKSAMIPEALADSTWGTFMTVIRSPMNPFLRWVLRTSIFNQQVGLFATSTINQLTSSMLHNFEIPVPPPAEQARIARFLEDNVEEIDELIQEANRFIELSKEHRRALITAAVTGQLDLTRSAA